MKKIFVLVAALFVCSLFANAQNIVIEPELQTILNQKGDDYIDINIIFKSKMSTAELQALNCKSDSKEIRRELIANELMKFSLRTQSDVMAVLRAEERNNKVIDIESYWLTNFINCKAKRDVIYQLASHPDVAKIIYNQEMEVVTDAIETNNRDTQVSSVEIGNHLTHINADKTWDLGYTGKGVVVAILDSGVNIDHIDLKDHLWNGNGRYGFNALSPSQAPFDDRGHGTHCAGIICGDGNSGKITGVAPDATLMPIKLYGKNTGITIDKMTSGVQFAINNNADIVSISQGWMKTSDANRTILRETFDNLLSLGIVAVVAAGNDRRDLSIYPAPYNVRTPGDCPPPWLHPDQTTTGGLSSVVSVGAVDNNNAVLGLSSQGPVTWQTTSYNDYPYSPGMGLIRPDIVAPGSVYSLDYETNDGNDIRKDGTSMAAPCVAGVMALMLEKNPELSPADLCRIVETTAKKLSEKKNNDTGSGLIDALAAVQAVDFNVTTPYLNQYLFTKNLTFGENQNIELTLINNGTVSTSGITTVTLTTNDTYTTIVDGSKTYNAMAVGETASATFKVSVSDMAPDNHIVTFAVTATSGSYNRTFNIDVNISNEFVAPSISAEANGTSVNLTWNATNNATSYNVYRDDALLGNTTSTSYTDSGLEYGTIYAYTVTSKRGELESEHSMKIRVQTSDDPHGPTPTEVIANAGTVSWTNGGENSKGANVYRKDYLSGEETPLASKINGTSYTDETWNSLADGVYQYGVSNIYAMNENIFQESFDNITYELNDSQDGKWYSYTTATNGQGYNWSVAEELVTGQNGSVTIRPYLESGKAAFIKSPSYKKEVTYLVSPQMDFIKYNGNNVKLSFRYILPSWDADINTLQVMISTETNKGEWNELKSFNTNASEWTEFELDLSGYLSQKFYIAFVNTAGFGYGTGIDEVRISVEGSKESRIGWSGNVYKNVNMFVQDGNWSDTDNWATKQLPTLNDSHVIIAADATIANGNIEVNSLTINEGASLTLNEGTKLTVKGDFVNTDADALIINDGAQLAQNNDDVAATFKMNVINPNEWAQDSYGWQFISSPVKDAKIEDFIPKTDGYDLYKYDGNKKLSWLNYKDDNIYPEEPVGPSFDTITIGEGSTSSTAYFPVYFSYGLKKFSYSQQIYTSDEIGADMNGKYLTYISFEKARGSQNYERTVVVYIENIDKTQFNGDYDWLPMTSEPVFSGNVRWGYASGYVTIKLDTPFKYTGNNIVISVHDSTDTAVYIASGFDKFTTYTAGNNRAIYTYNKLDPKTGLADNGYAQGYRSTSNNKIQLVFTDEVSRSDNASAEALSFEETTFQQGVGYLVSYESETEATFKGVLNHEKSYDFEVAYNSSNNRANFHLLGNPFSFNMNWENISLSNMVDGYAVVNEEGSYEYATSGEIKVGDGFFVKAKGSNPSMSYDSRSVKNTNGASRFINVIASGKDGKDNVIINMSGKQEGFPKMSNLNENIAVVYVNEGNVNYGIYNCNSNVKEVELSFKATQMGNYSIHIEADGEFDYITLVDRLTNAETDMLAGDYTFTASASEDSKRFMVRLAMNKNDIEAQKIFAYQSGNELVINASGSLQIFDVMGRMVYSNDVVSDNGRIDISIFNKAAYILRLINEDGVKTQKVVIY